MQSTYAVHFTYILLTWAQKHVVLMHMAWNLNNLAEKKVRWLDSSHDPATENYFVDILVAIIIHANQARGI